MTPQPPFASDLSKELNNLLTTITSTEQFTRRLFYLNFEQVRRKHAELAELMLICAVPRYFNAEIIGVLRNRPKDQQTNERLLENLKQFSFVQVLDNGSYAYHDSIREMLLQEWYSDHRSDQFEQSGRRLVNFYSTWIREQFKKNYQKKDLIQDEGFEYWQPWNILDQNDFWYFAEARRVFELFLQVNPNDIVLLQSLALLERLLGNYHRARILDTNIEKLQSKLEKFEHRNRLLFWVKNDSPEWQDAGKMPVYCFEANEPVTEIEVNWLVEEMVKKDNCGTYAFIVYKHFANGGEQRLQELNRRNGLVIIPFHIAEILQVLRIRNGSRPSRAYRKLVDLKKQWSVLKKPEDVSAHVVYERTESRSREKIPFMATGYG